MKCRLSKLSHAYIQEHEIMYVTSATECICIAS